jgi:predicted double-glycine peptidase
LINSSFVILVLAVFGLSFTSYAYSWKTNLEKTESLPLETHTKLESRKEVILVTTSEFQEAEFDKNKKIAESNKPLPKPVNIIRNIEPSPKEIKVPFYSQFTDITSPQWQKVGCGIASLAMLIEYYEPGEVSVDKLLAEGISSGSFLEDAGWTHSGLANLVKKYGLTGKTFDYSANSIDSAYAKLVSSLATGPVMASVFYTFDPKSPIPHLVVINNIDSDTVYYNDPSDKSGNRTISSTKFKAAWKKRFIEVRPA